MIKILLSIILLSISIQTYASCNAGSGFQYAALGFMGKKEDAAALKAKCTEPVKKKVLKKIENCDACVADLQQRSGQTRGYNIFIDTCKKQGRCSISYGAAISADYASTMILPCEDQMFCSEDTQMCEYICPDSFSYNFASGQCEKLCADDEIAQNNQCVSCQNDKVPNESKTQCICPEGKVEQGNECVESSNPCEHLGSEYRYYRFQSPECKIPEQKESYLSPCLNTDCLRQEMSLGSFNPQTIFNVSAQYVGCEKTGSQNNSVFRINYQRSTTRSYKHQEHFKPIFAVCTDKNASGTHIPIHLGNFSTYLSDTDNYVRLESINNCYKYRFFIQDGDTFYDIGDYDIPYETCQECPTGTMKIGGVCSCPSGMKMENNTCVEQSNCGTESNFYAGKCECSTPYYYPSIHGMKYSCSNPPTYSRFGNEINKESKTQLSASVSGCSFKGYLGEAHATISWSASNDSDYPVRISAVCTDPTYLELFPDPGPGEFSFYGYGGPPMTQVDGKSSGSGTFELAIDGTCYNYKLVAVDIWTWMGETDFSVNYHCGE